jgi:methylthioribose-1-phosphate isomerase
LSGTTYSAVELAPDNRAVILLEQRRLPTEELYVTLTTVDEVARAIRDMVVRGAPAIGITAAYGFVLAAQSSAPFAKEMERAAAVLRASRPTAVNLFWAVDRMLAKVEQVKNVGVHGSRVEALAEEARAIHREDVVANRRMGELGAAFIPDGATVLTHCNAGAIATGGYGTALGVLRAARDAGKRIRVLADETRPYLQGARLTAWELARDGLEVSVITDGMAASFFGRGEITCAVVGSDRIARNGDVANKIGTYGVACLARFHERPFYVAAPWSTVDLETASGAAIPIEQRSLREVTHFGEQRLVPENAGALNPSFDVTPASLVSAIFTERGVIQPVSAEELRRLA